MNQIVNTAVAHEIDDSTLENASKFELEALPQDILGLVGGGDGITLLG